MNDLSPVLRFARRHQRGAWSASLFPSALPARLVVEPVYGGRIPGASCRSVDGGLSIAIDKALEMTDLYIPVLTHEVSHLLCAQTRGVWFCAPFGDPSHNPDAWTSGAEKTAWYGAALLAIDDARMARFRAGQALADDIAADCRVPVELVNLRYAVVDALKSTLPIHQHALSMAYQRWMAFLGPALRQAVGR